MATINEEEFRRVVDGIVSDRESIVHHNPLGSAEEILLWMLLSCLVSYLSLSEQEAPCFAGTPNARTYREAIDLVLSGRKSPEFAHRPIMERMTAG